MIPRTQNFFRSLPEPIDRSSHAQRSAKLKYVYLRALANVDIQLSPSEWTSEVLCPKSAAMNTTCCWQISQAFGAAALTYGSAAGPKVLIRLDDERWRRRWSNSCNKRWSGMELKTSSSPGCFGIFSHGSVAGISEALQENPGFRYYLSRNKQVMCMCAAAFAKMSNGLRTLVCRGSIGPGATNMVTGAAPVPFNRLPVLLLPGDIFARRIGTGYRSHLGTIRWN